MSDNDLTTTDQTLIDDEVARYTRTWSRIQSEFKTKTTELGDDEKLARKLTAEMVAARKDEEKQFLLSDEQVAHGLAKLRFRQTNALSDLARQPYFARVIYHEKGRDVEFKLGVAGFPEERIIDWRKAPISKLYYDYEEGDDYDDEIAGVERQGHIKLKRAYRGQNDVLSAIELKDTSYVLSHGRWNKFKKQNQAVFSVRDKEKLKELLAAHMPQTLEQLAGGDGYLSQILALLSAEQFRLISSDLSKPVIIQGSAGTGKTTVALHRLAWLLFEGNSPAREETALVVMFNPTLAHYVANVLPALGVHGVRIVTYLDWARDVIRSSARITHHFRSWDVPEAVARFKADLATVEQIKAAALAHPEAQPQAVMEQFYRSASTTHRERAVREYLVEQVAKGFFDHYDLAPLLELIFERTGGYVSQKYPAELDHLVIDEAQDFTLAELRTLVRALKDRRQLTIAGDLGQKILENRDFGTWQEMLEKLGLTGVDVLNLSIAYRSTYQIYELAEFIRDPNLPDEELKMIPRFGPEPHLTIAHNFNEAVEVTRGWIEDVININHSAIGAVVCRTPQEARKVFEALLKHGLHGIRFGDAQHFEFTPGITVTDVRQVKGLEFQCLLLFNPSEKNYRTESRHDRNLLYVAITRAAFKLDLVCFEPQTAMLPEFLTTVDLTAVEEEVDDVRFLFGEEAKEREQALKGEETADGDESESESEDLETVEYREIDGDNDDMVDELQGDEEIETDDDIDNENDH